MSQSAGANSQRTAGDFGDRAWRRPVRTAPRDRTAWDLRRRGNWFGSPALPSSPGPGIGLSANLPGEPGSSGNIKLEEHRSVAKKRTDSIARQRREIVSIVAI